MNEMQTIKIEDQLHIITARSEVRNLARELGFDTMTQARLSMATSSLAYLMDLGGCCAGIIQFGPTTSGKKGLQIECTAYYGSAERCSYSLTADSFAKLKQMVDTLNIEELPTRDVRVVLIKWKK